MKVPPSNWSTVFEIYLSAHNKLVTNIKLPPDWSYAPTEQEVLLMPGFCYMVVGTERDDGTKIVKIKLVEIAH